MTIKTDVRTLAPLNSIARLLAILPSENGCRVLYAVIIIVIFVGMYVYEIYGKFVVTSKIFELTVHLIDVASDFICFVANIGSIIGLNLIKGSETKAFIANFQSADQQFKHVNFKNHRNFLFYTELIVAHAFFVVYSAYDWYVWSPSIGFRVYKYYVVKIFQNYHLMTLGILMRFYALSLKYRFEIINRILLNFKAHQEVVTNFCESKVAPHVEDNWSVKRIMKVYTCLSELVNQYNSTFGLYFVILYTWIIINLLMPINLALVYGNGDKELLGYKFGADLIVLCIMWSAFPLIATMGIFSSCEYGAAEAAKTSNICYIILHDLPNNEKGRVLREDIQELANQTSNASPTFSASGFFTINYNVVFSMVGSISSYLIVLIQFHK